VRVLYRPPGFVRSAAENEACPGVASEARSRAVNVNPPNHARVNPRKMERVLSSPYLKTPEREFTHSRSGF
ncbi:MAG: hypothetical protein PF795_15735, partial [Kiritimatiellae bacterium]|nr:hypothetical protein [Kiritimatiellia bacterium]